MTRSGQGGGWQAHVAWWGRLAGACGLALGGSLLLAPAAMAQDTPPKGMPQLDFANPALLAQVIWGAVIFAAFYMLCARWVLPRMGAVIESRQQSIGDNLETARKAKAEADAAASELGQARRSAGADAHRAVQDAMDAAKKRATEATAQADARLEQRLSEAEAQIGQARASALSALQEVAGDTASLVVSRLTGRPADEAAVRSATEAALAERAKAA